MVSSLYAQARMVSGTVTDMEGTPLVGATVMEKGTVNGTTTNTEGAFRIRVTSANPIIIVQYVGYIKQEIPVNGRTSIAVKMEDGGALEELTIVGSRSVGRSNITSTAPIDILNIKEVTSKSGQLDLNQILQYVAPSFNSNRQSGSDGTDHVDPASLRGLGPDQTLVLVNGKRRHQSSLVNVYGTRGRGNTGTDLNAIPAAAIERIEILRDGAAAQYGSDAIAGVINIVLKSSTDVLEANLNGGAFKAQYRFDDKSFDGLNYNVNGNYGVKVGKRGFVNLTADYNSRDHTNRANAGNLDDLSRREFGDGKMVNAAFMLNAKFPVTNDGYFYLFGGSNFRDGASYAWTRFADSPRNITAIYPNGFDPLIGSTITDHSVSAGYRTSLSGWNVDISNTFGYNRFHYDVSNTLNRSMGNTLATNQTVFDAGGFDLSQNTVNVDFTRPIKSPFEILNVAFGGEYRNEKYSIFAGEEASWRAYDTTQPAGSQGFPGFQPTDEVDASRSAVGVYADAEATITQKFVVGLAGRFENYSDFGSNVDGKLSTLFRITPQVNLRGTLSTGFRAPSLPQINFNQTVTNFVGGQPVEVLIGRNGGSAANGIGIPKLKQEESVNASLGLTLKPSSTMVVTLDAYNVAIDDRIILTGQFSAGDAGVNLPAGVGKAQFFTNSVSTTTQGLDVVLSDAYEFSPNSRLNWSLAANLNKMSIDSVYTTSQLAAYGDTYFDLRERYFLLAAAPKSKINLTASHVFANKLTSTLRLTRFGEVTLADWNYSENELDVYKAKTVADLSFGVNLNKNAQLTLGGNNIFNVYPDISSAVNTESGGAWDPVQMGNNGSFWYARLNLKF